MCRDSRACGFALLDWVQPRLSYPKQMQWNFFDCQSKVSLLDTFAELISSFENLGTILHNFSLHSCWLDIKLLTLSLKLFSWWKLPHLHKRTFGKRSLHRMRKRNACNNTAVFAHRHHGLFHANKMSAANVYLLHFDKKPGFVFFALFAILKNLKY